MNVLDFVLSGASLTQKEINPDDVCSGAGDFVELTGIGRRCGLSEPTGDQPLQLMQTTELGRNVLIAFHSDETFEERGFWIQFKSKELLITCALKRCAYIGFSFFSSPLVSSNTFES